MVVRGGHVAVIVPVKRAADGTRVLGLPKGHPDPGEAPEAAAQREVREETGLTTELIGELGEIAYSYQAQHGTVAKRVRFYLFEYRSGDLADHDHEIEDARWMALSQAARELTYEGERKIVARALSQLSSDR